MSYNRNKKIMHYRVLGLILSFCCLQVGCKSSEKQSDLAGTRPPRKSAPITPKIQPVDRSVMARCEKALLEFIHLQKGKENQIDSKNAEPQMISSLQQLGSQVRAQIILPNEISLEFQNKLSIAQKTIEKHCKNVFDDRWVSYFTRAILNKRNYTQTWLEGIRKNLLDDPEIAILEVPSPIGKPNLHRISNIRFQTAALSVIKKPLEQVSDFFSKKGNSSHLETISSSKKSRCR